MVDLGFRGEVSRLYRQYRVGYPDDVIATLVDSFGLAGGDHVVDVGCGTGQLTLPLARLVGFVVGVDPEAEMLAQARAAAAEAGIDNVAWLLGSDADLPGLRPVLGGSDGAGPALVTIGHAVQWTDHETFFTSVHDAVRRGGGIAVATNGVPLWLQDTPWSRALRNTMEGWFGGELTSTCGTDRSSQEEYRASLVSAGFAVDDVTVEYSHEMSLEQMLGGLYSAFSVDHLPVGEARAELDRRIAAAVGPYGPLSEHVAVRLLLGRA